MPAITPFLNILGKPTERRFRLYETIANFHQFSILHTLVAITLCYHLIFSPESSLSPETRNILMLILLVATAVIWRIPPRFFGRGWFVGSWILGDTFLAIAIVFLTGQAGSGLYVTFFLIILLAAFAQSLKQTLALSTILCGGYGAVLYMEGAIGNLSLEEDRLLQIPLLLVVATFYGHALELLRKGRAQQWDLVSQRQKSQEALHESEERYRSVIEAATDAIIVTDDGGRMISWNGGAQQIFDYREQDIQGKPLTFLLSEQHRPDIEQDDGVRKTLMVGRAIECIGVRKDGSEFPLELSLSTWETAQGRWYGCIIRDITERKRGEQVKADLEAQKQEALRRMAGGIAHDFNNLLTVIMGYCDILLPAFAPGHAQHGHVQQIKKAGIRATELARQLLIFSRRYMIETKMLDLNAVLTDMEAPLRQALGEGIELVIVKDPALGRVRVHPDHLAEAVINLSVNAREAMPRGGRLTIETAHIQVDEASSESGDIPPGPYVQLRISDTGCGMDAETRAHIFDPFFTTKQPEGRTGMGLSTVYGIVKQVGGHISVRSEPQQGTTFTIYFPQADHLDEPRRA